MDLGVPRSSRGGGTNEINRLNPIDVPQEVVSGTLAELPQVECPGFPVNGLEGGRKIADIPRRGELHTPKLVFTRLLKLLVALATSKVRQPLPPMGLRMLTGYQIP